MSKENTSEELEISLPDLLLTIWEIRLIIIVLAIAGGIAGVLLSAGGSTLYETRASMLVIAKNAAGTYQDNSEYPTSGDVQLATDLARTVQLLATSDRVLDRVIEQVENESGEEEVSIEELRQAIEVTEETDTAFLWLTLRWEDSQLAAELLNSLMDTLPDVMLEVMDIGSVNIIDKAREVAIVSENVFQTGVIGILAGILAGGILGICYYLFVPKIRRNDMLESLGLEVDGTIPFVPEKERTAGLYLDDGELPRNYIEAFGRLTAVFRYQTEQEKAQIIAVTSTLEGEGKTTIVYNLALSLTRLGCKVLLLDFDFQKGILYELAKKRKEKDGDVRTIPRDGEHLEQLLEQMHNGIYTIQGFSQDSLFQVDNSIFPALCRMKESFDYILIDTPPVGILSDIQQMRGLMDGVLLVVRQNRVTYTQVMQSAEFLEKTGIRILSCVVNRNQSER